MIRKLELSRPIEEGMELIMSEKDKNWKGLKETFHFE